MSERRGYDPSRDPNANPNIPGAYFDQAQGCWMMPADDSRPTQSSHYVEQANLPVVIQGEQQKGLIFGQVTRTETYLDGNALPAVIGMLGGILKSTLPQQQPDQYSTDYAAHLPHVEQIPTGEQPGWDLPPTDGPLIIHPDTSETRRLPATEGVTDSQAATGAKEKLKRAVPTRFLMKMGAVTLLASSVFAGVSYATDRTDPNLILFKADVPQIIDNYGNWWPVKAVSKIGNLIPG